MNHRVRSVLAAVLIMVVSILLPSDFQFENTDRFVKEQSSSIQMTAQYTDGIERKFFMIIICVWRIQEKQFLRRVRNSVRARRDCRWNCFYF